MITLTTIFVKGGLRPRITLVWFDDVRGRPRGVPAWACGSGGRWLTPRRSDATARCGALSTTRRTATLGCCVGPAPCRFAIHFSRQRVLHCLERVAWPRAPFKAPDPWEQVHSNNKPLQHPQALSPENNAKPQ